MTNFQFDFSGKPGGERAPDGGGFHLSFRSGSRPSRAGAIRAHDYIAREGRCDDPELDRGVYVESGNMPSWAADEARENLVSVQLVNAAASSSHCSLPPAAIFMKAFNNRFSFVHRGTAQDSSGKLRRILLRRQRTANTRAECVFQRSAWGRPTV